MKMTRNNRISLPVYNPLIPYNDLPELPPTADIETKTILKKCITARAALAELKSAAELIPDATVLINSLPMLEAQASSDIENIVTTADNLFQYAQTEEENMDAATKEVYRYRTALHQGFLGLKKKGVATNTAVDVCAQLKGVEAQIRRVPGTKVENKTARTVVYTPPVGEHVIRTKLANWEKFLHREGADPLIRMAVGHYQFEAIHPFTDGNGRTGRILNLLFLIEMQLLSSPILYLSGYILRRKAEYYRLLREVTERRQWEPWILYNLDAVEQTAHWTNKKITAIRMLMSHTEQYIRKKLPKIVHKGVAHAIFTQPYCRIGNLMATGVERHTASGYLKQLCKIGVLQEIKRGRNKLFVHPKFVGLLSSHESEFTEYGK